MLRALFSDSDRKVDKMFAKGTAALADGQPVVAAMHLTEAYSALAQMKDPFAIPFQITIATKLIEAYTMQGDMQEIAYWEGTIVELKRELGK